MQRTPECVSGTDRRCQGRSSCIGRDDLVHNPNLDCLLHASGDALMLGVDANRPRAKAGDRIEIHAAGLGSLRNQLVAEAA